MAQFETEATPQFSRPGRQVVLLLAVTGLTAVGAVFLAPRVREVLEANPYLNGFIFFVFVIGVLACFWQVWQLFVSVRWIERFAAEDVEAGPAPRLLGPLATLLRSRGARMQINPTSTRSILDSVATRIDEVRDITRYIVNLLIFLGLLGTFYGLATTVPAVVDTIRSLAPQEGEGGTEVFNRLMSGLESQLGGMGVAFASSLLGLAGSLVVGLLELFVGHGQNRFYRELEEWLSSITRLGFAGADEGMSSEMGALAGVLDQMVEQMDGLQHLFTQSDVSRSVVDDKLGRLADSLDVLTEKLGRDTSTDAALIRVAEGQERLLAALERGGAGEGLDAESRMRLRSIDVQMLRILEEISAGRQESMAEIRADLSNLGQAIRGERARPRGLQLKSEPER
jgi:hypothetical protein